MVWLILVQPLLFGAIGIEIDFRLIQGSLIWKTVIILALGTHMPAVRAVALLVRWQARVLKMLLMYSSPYLQGAWYISTILGWYCLCTLILFLPVLHCMSACRWEKTAMPNMLPSAMSALLIHDMLSHKVGIQPAMLSSHCMSYLQRCLTA